MSLSVRWVPCAMLFSFALSGCFAAQDAAGLAAIRQGQKLTATVTVVAFDSNGRILGAPEVKLFVSEESHKNFAGSFHGGVAGGIPYGDYRIEGRLPAFSSDLRTVRVYQQHVTVVLGLTLSGELPDIPPDLRGRIVGELPLHRFFVRLLGVYANVSIDSTVDSGGRFDLGGLSDGTYILLVLGENGILASRWLRVPYVGPPLEVVLTRTGETKLP